MPRKRTATIESTDSVSESAADAADAAADAAVDDQTSETVTLRTAPAEWAQNAVVVGEFNDWSTEATPMIRVGDHFEATVSLAPGREYRYRFLFDGQHWDNDPEADDYVPNEFGSDDSVRRR